MPETSSLPGESAPEDSLILVINPGSTSTKLAIFRGMTCLAEASLTHAPAELKAAGDGAGQEALRREAIKRFIAAQGFAPADFAVFMARGGLFRPMEGGVYAVNAAMLDDARSERYGRHASNLGALLAASLGREADKPAYVADPPVVDELCELARYSGHPDVPRRALFHALSQKAVARLLAERLGADVSALNLVVAHLGGGISVGVHARGRVVDVSNALDGEGPFSPERTGGMPVVSCVRYLAERGVAARDVDGVLNHAGGLLAYLGTRDGAAAAERAGREPEARRVLEAMAYQVAKEIGAMATVVNGHVDGIALTGGLARLSLLTDGIEARVRFLAPVYCFAENEEMAALAAYAVQVMRTGCAQREYGESLSPHQGSAGDFRSGLEPGARQG